MRKLIVHLERWLAKTRLGTRLYARPYRKVVAREIALASIRTTDIVYQIGCGSVPFTALLVAEETNAKVIAIDNDTGAVKRAQRIVKKRKLEHLIDVRHYDGTEPLDEPYTVVMLALQTRPLKKVLDALDFQRARVIVREPTEKYKERYDALPPEYTVVTRAHHGMRAFASSGLLKGSQL